MTRNYYFRKNIIYPIQLRHMVEILISLKNERGYPNFFFSENAGNYIVFHIVQKKIVILHFEKSLFSSEPP